MPKVLRRRSDSADSSVTEMSSDAGEPEVAAETALPAKASKRTAAAAKASEPSKSTKEADPQITKRRSNRTTSQTVNVDDAPTASKKAVSRKGAKETKEAQDGDVGELESKMKGVSLKVSPKEPKPKPVHTHDGDHFNPIPLLPSFEGSQPQLFVWGAGNHGQFGMGVEILREFSRPQKNTLVEDMMNTGQLGLKGLGFVAAVAGGMSSLFIDSKGTVCT